ncbi:MAG: UDP-N-acetylglucosamine 1-carboxyvinyltransferase [Firmicutes bacterium HGW-Firmicutes-1]|jgi:UDP-N-acetylglucosamine 1-carboxyvinyltransferase|nr:MAG: UDP-N-acetylglucosamine 1-carboxyvinyltransferase [Firmicutes bacterium HGW-Firmicutes-1]
MGKYSVVGGNRLEGDLTVQGSKNAVLPILAATILNKGKSYLHNCPKILDVYNMINILKAIGCSVNWQDNVLIIDSSVITTDKIPENYVQTMRSSIIVLGSVLGRLKSVMISFPGGCSIGVRPIDLHIKALKQMNINIFDTSGFLKCTTNEIKGSTIHLDYPSVGATENVMLVAVLSSGTTKIYNAAKEPEIIELEIFLNAMGAKISGAGSDCIMIQGVKKLDDVEYQIMPDRIVAGTFLAATAITGGELLLQNVHADHLDSICCKLEEMGCFINSKNNKLFIRSDGDLKAINLIRTQPHPGFPTDMQAQIMACLSIAKGTSIISETIFESRFKHVPELSKMGADIIIEGRLAIIKGVNRLQGSEVFAEDLRGGAALIIAGLAAEGNTVVHNSQHIRRGYEDFDDKLKQLGANISYID